MNVSQLLSTDTSNHLNTSESPFHFSFPSNFQPAPVTSKSQFENSQSNIKLQENSSTIKSPENVSNFKVSQTSLITFPYNLNSLTWDPSHRENKEKCYCYCGKDKSNGLGQIMLQCSECKQWFHTECLKEKPAALPVPGDRFYNFQCAVCNKKPTDTFTFIGKSWTDVVRIAIYNLYLIEQEKKSNKIFFHLKDDICSFMDRNWDRLCFSKTRTKTWENTVGSSLSTKSDIFQPGETIGLGFWSLIDFTDPSLLFGIKPPSTSTKRSSHSSSNSTSTTPTSAPTVPKKRKALEEKKERPPKRSKPKPIPLPLPVTKLYYDPIRCGYTEMCLAKENSSHLIKIDPDRLTVANEGGYRTARASFGVSQGSWYYELQIVSKTGNVRSGWSTEKGELEAPVGFDKFGYSYRDIKGTIFHQSRGKDYGEPYGQDDIIGFYIYLPESKTDQTNITNMNPNTKVNDPPVLTGSQIAFFKNGKYQGIAFSDLFEGTYYPAVSLYMGSAVKFNFGPNFKYPPTEFKFLPICDSVSITLQNYQKQQEEEKQQQQKELISNGKEESFQENLELLHGQNPNKPIPDPIQSKSQ